MNEVRLWSRSKEKRKHKRSKQNPSNAAATVEKLSLLFLLATTELPHVAN